MLLPGRRTARYAGQMGYRWVVPTAAAPSAACVYR